MKSDPSAPGADLRERGRSRLVGYSWGYRSAGSTKYSSTTVSEATEVDDPVDAASTNSNPSLISLRFSAAGGGSDQDASRSARRSSGTGMGRTALTAARPVLPIGTQMRENRAAATTRVS